MSTRSLLLRRPRREPFWASEANPNPKKQKVSSTAIDKPAPLFFLSWTAGKPSSDFLDYHLYMSAAKLTTLRLGDNINYPQKGESVGVHYTLRNESGQVIESTYKWGKLFEWRVGQASIIPELDEAIRSVSLGGKIRLTVSLAESREPSALTYELELLYIKWVIS